MRIIGYNDAEYAPNVKMRIYKATVNEPEFMSVDVKDCGEMIIQEYRIVCIPANRIKLERGWGLKPAEVIASKPKKIKKQLVAVKKNTVKRKRITTNEMFGLLYLRQLEFERDTFIRLRGW